MARPVRRRAYDRVLTAPGPGASACAGHASDLIVLAGFMKLVGLPSLGSFGGGCVNTHPALLPSFPGTPGVRDALAHGVKVTGCTVFIVDAGVDAGPIVAKACVPVADDDDEATLHERIKRTLLALADRWVVYACGRGSDRRAGQHAGTQPVPAQSGHDAPRAPFVRPGFAQSNAESLDVKFCKVFQCEAASVPGHAPGPQRYLASAVMGQLNCGFLRGAARFSGGFDCGGNHILAQLAQPVEFMMFRECPVLTSRGQSADLRI
jgi:formyl transferase-like protein